MYASFVIEEHHSYSGFVYEFELEEVGGGVHWEVSMFHVSPVVGALSAVEFLRDNDPSESRRYTYDKVARELSWHLLNNEPDEGFSPDSLDSGRVYLDVFERIRDMAAIPAVLL